MRFQLVLQWRTESSLASYDSLIETENLLIEGLAGRNKVDGHDAGSGELNIFIFTDDPVECFGEVKAILAGRKEWDGVRAGFREIGEDDYTILWPKHLSKF
jgi:hypothetical protein